MTQDEIIEMAKQASLSVQVPDLLIPVFERFAKLVAAKEREACAKVVESFGKYESDIAEAIRARGEA